MKRKLLMVVLGLGAVLGFGAGFARMCHAGSGPHGGHFGRHAEFEQSARQRLGFGLQLTKTDPLILPPPLGVVAARHRNRHCVGA